MIFRNGKDWLDPQNKPLYDTHLKKMCGGKLQGIVKAAKFELTSRYSGLKLQSNGREELKLKKSSAKAVGIPVEYTWTDDNGHNVLIRYVTHTEQKKEGNIILQVEHPGSIYCRDNKFEVNNNAEKFWFYMVSPYCENGFYTDLTVGDDPKKNIWGIELEKVRMAISQRSAQGIVAIYKYVDESRERKILLAESKARKAASDFVWGLPEEKKREVYAALGKENSDFEEIETIHLFLIELAESDPTVRRADGLTRDSLMKNDGQNVSYTATVNKAEQLGVILYRKHQRSWSFDGEKKDIICLVTQGKNPTEFLVEWLRTKDDGGQVYAAIKAGVKAKDEVAV